MFDFGFWELTLVMVVVLLVVGPERLPRLAAQAGRWFGRAKRTLAAFRADIESEIRSVELKEMLEKQQSEIGELKAILKDTQREFEEDLENEDDKDPLVEAVEKQIEASKPEPVSDAPTAEKKDGE